MGGTAVTSESNMGERQVPKEVKLAILSPVFSAATNDIHCFGRALASAGVVGRKEGHVD